MVLFSTNVRTTAAGQLVGLNSAHASKQIDLEDNCPCTQRPHSPPLFFRSLAWCYDRGLDGVPLIDFHQLPDFNVLNIRLQSRRQESFGYTHTSKAPIHLLVYVQYWIIYPSARDQHIPSPSIRLHVLPDQIKPSHLSVFQTRPRKVGLYPSVTRHRVHSIIDLRSVPRLAANPFWSHTL